MLGLDLGGLATLGLPPRRLPATHLPQAVRLLAVTLVPTPRLVRAAAPFAQTDPRAGASPSGQTSVLYLNLVGAHGRLVSQGKARAECASVLLGRLSQREPNGCSPVYGLVREQDKEQDGFRNAFGKETLGPANRRWLSSSARNWL